MEEQIRCRGHEHVTASHASTFEVTADNWLTPAGDCIIGIAADRTPADFDPAFVQTCQRREATITVTISVADRTETIIGRGDPALTFESDRSLVGRTSSYVDDRTVLLEADTAAADLDRNLVKELSTGSELFVTITVD